MRTTRLLALLAAFAAFSAYGTQIMWVGVDENAMVHLPNQTINIAYWITSLQCAPVDIGGRIRIGDTALPAGYEYPKDQNPPAVSFDDDITEFGLVVVDDNDEPTGAYADWQPIKLPEDITKSHIAIYYDIGYWDENNNWDFVSVATAVGYVDNLWDNHTYTAGTLAPPDETSWYPDHFYAVPEPSTAFLTVLGALFLLKRRKQ